MRLIANPRIRGRTHPMLNEHHFSIWFFFREDSEDGQNVTIFSNDLMLLAVEAVLLTELLEIKKAVRTREFFSIIATIEISKNKWRR